MLKSRKKLRMFGALPPYLGGKRRLCPVIFREIARIIARARWRDLTFLDAFLGGGSVSLYAKAQGFTVIATDIAERAIVIGRALVQNSRVKLTREDVLRVLGGARGAAPPGATPPGPPGRIEAMMVPSTFTKEQARFLDNALRVAGETADPAKANLLRLLALRTALLCHAYAQVRKGTIHRVTTGEYESITESAVRHYIDGLRLTTPARLWELAQQINGGVFAGRASVVKRSVLDALPEIEADVAYFDPPYPGVMSYEREYRTIDEILEGQSRPTSPFTAKDGARMLDALFERAVHIPIWILSLGNAVVGIEELEAKMLKFGRKTKAIALRYQHLPAVATEEKKRTNEEFIVIGVDEDSALLHSLQVGKAVGKQLPAGVIEQDVNFGGSERTALGGFPDNPEEQGHAHLTQEAGPGFTGQAVSEAHLAVDDPDARLVEGTIHRHAERCLGRHDGPASLGTDPLVKEEPR